MKKIVMCLCWLLPLFAGAQEKKEIAFTKAKSWKQILAQAKVEKKNIFIDAYATWCGPCKKMDADVYTDSKIADYVNQSFIPVKIQFDQTKNDPPQIKDWYSDAKKIQEDFQITAFPTYLFISPSGQLIYRSMGYQDVDQFMTLLKTANDPKQNYASQLKQFEQGKIKGQSLLKLALQAKEYKQDSIALKVAIAYKKTVIDRSSPQHVITPDLLKYLYKFYDLILVDDRIADYMYHHPLAADSGFNSPGYTRDFTDYLVYRSKIDPVVKPSGKYADQLPNWNNLEDSITKSYDRTTAKRLMLSAKLDWYGAKEDWQNVIKYNIEKIETNGLDTAGLGKTAINNLVYYVFFKYSDDPIVLQKAASYMETIMKAKPNVEYWIDTYANVLYKLGRKEEAIAQEQKALAIAQNERNKKNISIYSETLDKIKNNQPTW
jgi:thioredoxin-related protein